MDCELRSLEKKMGEASEGHPETRVGREQIRRGCREEHGQAILEFAFVLMMLLVLFMGIVVFGAALNNYLSLTNATAISAQQLSISRGQTTDPCSTAAQAFYSAAPNLNPSNLTFSIVLNDSNVGGVSCSSSSTTSGAAADLVAGTTAQVAVSYPCNLTILGRNLAPSCALVAQTAENIQ